MSSSAGGTGAAASVAGHPVTPHGVQGNVAWYAAPRLWAKGMQALCLPVYARMLSPGEMGVVVAIGALGGIVELAISPGFEGLYLRWAYTNRSRDGCVEGMGTLVVSQLALVIFGSVLLLGFGDIVVEALLPGIPRWPFYDMMLITVAVASLGAPTRARWRYLGRADTIAVIGFTQSMISVVTTLLALLVFQLGAVSLLLGPLMAELLLFPIWLPRIVSAAVEGWSRDVFRTARPLIIAGVSLGLSTWALTALPRMFLQRYHGSAEVGVYGMAYQIGASVMLMSIVLNKEWQRLVFRFASTDTHHIQNIWNRSICLFAAVGSMLTLLSADLARIILGQQYLAVGGIIPFILVIAVIQVPRYFMYNLGLAGKNSAAVPTESVLAVAVCLIANVTLVPVFGTKGAALAGIIAFASGCVFFLFQRWNYLRIDNRATSWLIVFAGAFGVSVFTSTSLLTTVLAVPLAAMALREGLSYWRFLGSVMPAVVER